MSDMHMWEGPREVFDALVRDAMLWRKSVVAELAHVEQTGELPLPVGDAPPENVCGTPGHQCEVLHSDHGAASRAPGVPSLAAILRSVLDEDALPPGAEVELAYLLEARGVQVAASSDDRALREGT